MIQTSPKTERSAHGMGSSKSFSVCHNEKAFEIIMKGMYENVVRAVLSELSANAADSHIEANNEDPFEIWLPETLDPNFKIRDYGTGLSESFMMNEYLQVFYSTKDQSNEFTGSFGMGRMTALAICNSYTLTSFQNNKKRIYSIGVNKGIPEIHFVSDSPTDEKDGVEITFAVPSNDIASFYTESLRVFKFYAIQPIVHNLGSSLPVPEYLMKHEVDEEIVWGILKDQERSQVTMGGYCYDVNIGNLGFHGTLRSVSEMPFLLAFNVGELDVASNRQSLSYTDKTKESLKKRLLELQLSFEQEVLSLFNGFTSYYEACREFYKISGNKYKTICNKLELDGTIKIGDRSVLNYFRFDEQEKVSVSLFTRKNQKHHYGRRSANHRREVYSSNAPVSFKDSIVLINDLKTKNTKFVKTSKLIEEKTGCSQIYLFSFDSEEDRIRLTEEYGLENVRLYSEFYNEVPKSQRKQGVFSKCLSVGEEYGESYFNESNVDVANEEFVYLTVRKGEVSSKFIRDQKKVKKGGDAAYYKFLTEANCSLIFIRGNSLEKIAKQNPNAIHFDDWVSKLKEDCVNLSSYLSKREVFSRIGNRERFFHQLDLLKNLSEHADFESVKLNESEKTLSNLPSSILRALKIEKTNQKQQLSVDKITNYIDKKWPLSQFIERYEFRLTNTKLINALKS